MILEVAHIPSQFIRQESDWKKLCNQFPGLDQYFLQENAIQESLKEAYRDYVSNFSASLISLSLNRASFLFFFSKLVHAKNILDLGSGFSSYVFRLAHTGRVISVDDSESWLTETKRFLDKYKMDSSELKSLNQYTKLKDRPVADLCFLDLGDISLRQELLSDLVNDVLDKRMVLIVDDFHIPAYRGFITHLCAERQASVFSLRKATRRRLSHMALIMA